MGGCCAGCFGKSSTPDRLKRVQLSGSRALGEAALVGRYHRLPRRLQDDYVVSSKEVLGRGCEGKVIACRSKTNGQKGAIKSFALHGVGKEKKNEFENEATFFLSMDHPNIATLLDVYEEKWYCQFVMECMEGGQLMERIVSEGAFQVRDAAESAHQMLLAIEYLHSQNIVHRDIKPENFLYASKDYRRLKLIDFGFSYRYQPGEKLWMKCGTYGYAAPELFKPDEYYGSKCDLWSFGVVVFLLLAGYKPFGDSIYMTDADVQAAIQTGKYEIRPEFELVSADGKDFVDKLLVPEPERRIDAEAALRHIWLRRREEEEVAVGHESSIEQRSVMTSLRQFAEASVCRRACLSLMAWSVTPEEHDELAETFLKMDEDCSGTVSITEFSRAMRQQKACSSDEEIKAIFERLDSANTSQVHYTEFLSAMCCQRITMNEQLVHDTFHRLDTESVGYITKENLTRVLGNPEITDEQFAELSKQSKVKGKVDYAAFKSYILAPHCDPAHRQAVLPWTVKADESA